MFSFNTVLHSSHLIFQDAGISATFIMRLLVILQFLIVCDVHNILMYWSSLICVFFVSYFIGISTLHVFHTYVFICCFHVLYVYMGHVMMMSIWMWISFRATVQPAYASKVIKHYTVSCYVCTSYWNFGSRSGRSPETPPPRHPDSAPASPAPPSPRSVRSAAIQASRKTHQLTSYRDTALSGENNRPLSVLITVRRRSRREAEFSASVTVS